MVGSAKGGDSAHPRPWRRSPQSIGGQNTQALMVFVDDADAHYERARGAGANIETTPTNHDYGDEYWTDRAYEAVDLEGHHWWFVQRVSEAAKAKD